MIVPSIFLLPILKINIYWMFELACQYKNTVNTFSLKPVLSQILFSDNHSQYELNDDYEKCVPIHIRLPSLNQILFHNNLLEIQIQLHLHIYRIIDHNLQIRSKIFCNLICGSTLDIDECLVVDNKSYINQIKQYKSKVL